jgi:hypothetical protein
MIFFKLLLFLVSAVLFQLPAMCGESPDAPEQFNALLCDNIMMPSVLPEYWHTYVQLLKTGLAVRAEWYKLSDADIVARFAHSEHMISGIQLYFPEGEVENMSPLVLWVVHGTWAQASGEYYDDEASTFRDVLAFAAEMAQRKLRPVEVVSYVWSGENSHEARRNGGARLRMLAESFYSSLCGYGCHWAFGHSHGVNVILIASQETTFEGVVSLGAPIVESLYAPLHVNQLYHFYSLNDPWQFAGAMDRSSFKRLVSSPGLRSYSGQYSWCAVSNFRVMLDGLEPGHMSLKFLIPFIWKIIDERESHYQYHAHFNVNVARALCRVGQTVQVSIRETIAITDLIKVVSDQESAAVVIARLKEEIEYSQKQENVFMTSYRGKKMAARSPLWKKIVANWIELDTVISSQYSVFRPGAYKKYSLLDQDKI